MFGPVGHAYVYLIYGMHECLNVVAYDRAEAEGGGHGAEAGAVLLRGLEPTVGVELMRRRRGRAGDPDARLCSGPARLCQAMAVDRSLDSHDLTTGDELWLADAPDLSRVAKVAEGERIGVDYARDGWASRPWRFWLQAHPSVSRPAR
jgi:DNA-3-methyladenine glycosylase